MAHTPNPVPQVEISWLAAFWRVLKRIDKSKLNSQGMVVRNALAAAIPLGVAIAAGHPLIGVAITTGALNVSYSDGHDPYAHRARRMLSWSFLGAVAVFLGSVTGNFPALAIVAAAAWAFAAGLLVSISTRAGDLGLNTLVTLIVYGARGALSPRGAFYAGLLVLGGGLLQTLLALLSWPIRRYTPERRAIGSIYLMLADDIKAHPEEIFSSLLKQVPPDVQDTLAALGRDHSVEGERLRLLVDQADRLRFSVYNVLHLRHEHLAGERQAKEPSSTSSEMFDQFGDLSCELLHSIGQSLLQDNPTLIHTNALKRLQALVEDTQKMRRRLPDMLYANLASAADVLLGQLRVVSQLANNTTSEGAEEFAQGELAPPLKLQLRSWLDTLRANCHFQSAAFRHGVRLAVCVAVGDVIGRMSGVQRNYWFAMTVAVVLKPDFTTTISRGVLRLCGTFSGLLLATALYHLLPQTAFTQLMLVGIFTYLLRYAGPANYGIFSIAISGLIVFLIATTGVSPVEVVGERAINTAGGGLFALLAYAIWPTWERAQVPEILAEMIDRTRDYFHAVVARREQRPDDDREADLDRTRDAWRQARSAAEASVDRVGAEPRANRERLEILTSILSSSHAIVRITMELEAGLSEPGEHFMPSSFEGFAHDVEFTLYFLSAALRGSTAASRMLPPLREDHRRIGEEYEETQQQDDFILVETDRLTVALNTLREQVVRFAGMSVPEATTELAHTTIR